MSARLTRDAERVDEARISGIRRKTGETTRPTGLDDLQVAAFIERSRDPQLLLGADGRVQCANAAALYALGAADDGLLGGLLSDWSCGLSPQLLAAALETSVTQTLRLFDAKGRELPCTLTPLHNRRGIANAFLLELPRSEADSAQAGALASMTRLLAELGHDLNNQLAAVLNYAFVVERRLASGHATAEHMSELRASAWRAAGLTRWLQLGGRRAALAPGPLSLRDAVARITPLLRLLARDLALEVDEVDPQLAAVASVSDLELIIVALTGVSLERAAAGGTLRLSAELVPEMGRVRVRCAWSDSQAPHRAARSGKPSAHGSLRRALRRVHGRLGHDASSVWVDLATQR